MYRYGYISHIVLTILVTSTGVPANAGYLLGVSQPSSESANTK